MLDVGKTFRLSVLLVILAFVSACADAPREKDWRPAPVLFEAFETVFHADAALLSTSEQNGLPADSRVLLQPFSFFRGGLRWLGEHVLSDILAASEGVMVGARDFRPPSGLGPVQSTRCYVVMLRPGHNLEFRKYFSHAQEATIAGVPVWNWGAKLGEFGENDPRLSSLYAGLVGDSYVLISNSLPAFRSVAERLSGPGVATPTVSGIRDWDALRRYPAWGYRRYRHKDVIDPVAAGMSDVPSTAEALVFYADVAKRASMLRLYMVRGMMAARSSRSAGRVGHHSKHWARGCGNFPSHSIEKVHPTIRASSWWACSALPRIFDRGDRTRPVIPGTAIAAGSWLVGYVVTAWLAAGTSGASAYAVLCGWWLTAYMSARARIPVLSVGPLYIAYLAVFVGVYLTGSSALYREAPTLGLISAIAVGAAQALVVISPILFDGIWRRVTGAA